MYTGVVLRELPLSNMLALDLSGVRDRAKLLEELQSMPNVERIDEVVAARLIEPVDRRTAPKPTGEKKKKTG